MHVHVRWNSVLSIWPKTVVYSSPKSSKYSLSGMTIRLWQHHLTGKKQTNFNNPMKLSKRPKSMALAGCPSQNWSKRGRSQSCYLCRRCSHHHCYSAKRALYLLKCYVMYCLKCMSCHACSWFLAVSKLSCQNLHPSLNQHSSLKDTWLSIRRHLVCTRHGYIYIYYIW